MPVRLPAHSGSARAFISRDDKVKGKDVVIRLDCDLCHCEEGAEARDAAIHRVSGMSGRVWRFVYEGQWIATSYAHAMTRLKKGRLRDEKVWEKSGLFPVYGNKLFLDQFMN